MKKIAPHLVTLAIVASSFVLTLGLFRAAEWSGRSEVVSYRVLPSSPYRPLYLEGTPDAGPPVTSVVTTEGHTTVEGAPIVVLPDPILQPAESISLIEKLWRGGSIVQALTVLAYVLLTIASRKVAWLAQGSRAIWVGTLVVAAGTLAERAAVGTTPTVGMAVGALLIALTLKLNGSAPAQVAQGISTARALRSDPVAPSELDAMLEDRAAAMYLAYAGAAMGDKPPWSALELSERSRWRAAAKAAAA